MLEDVAYFKSILPETSVLERDAISPQEHAKYVCDWYNVYRADTPLILLPESTEQVSKILKYCNDNHLAVVPQSGNTGASGGKLDFYIVRTDSLAEHPRGFLHA